MADEFQPGICSGGWWNNARSNMVAMSAAASSTSHSSSAAVDASSGRGGALSWLGAEMARSCDDQPTASASGSSITYQEAHHSDLMTSSIMDSSIQIPNFGISASAMDWNQAILRSTRRAETSFQALLQDDMNSRTFFRQEPPINSDQVEAGETLANPFKEINHSLKLDQHGNQSDDYNISSFTLAPATSYGYSMQGLFESDNKSEQSIYHDNRSFLNNYQPPILDYRDTLTEQLQPSWPNFSQSFHTSSSDKILTNQLQFLSKTHYPEFTSQTFEQKPSCISQTQKSIISDSSSSIARKRISSSSSEPLFKKPRMEMPSPLPSFKVRKEKLGDRITALQQLVSPFGKTDTASVLHEAIESIKFLHDQVSVLSNPYLKSGHPHHQQISRKSKDNEESSPDLRSRGLCLVPVASTYTVANQTPSDFWTPTFGGIYR